jgi:hypothetical protein
LLSSSAAAAARAPDQPVAAQLAEQPVVVVADG